MHISIVHAVSCKSTIISKQISEKLSRYSYLIGNYVIVSFYSFTISSLVPPTEIEKHRLPFSFVKEGDMANLTCWTDTTNPAANITWIIDGHDVTIKATSSVYKTDYDGWGTTSTLRIHARRSDNRKAIQCSVTHRGQNISSLTETFTMNVTCKFLFIKILG